MELQPGAYFKIGQEGFEYAGVAKNPQKPEEVAVVGRVNPDEPVKEGALHRVFPIPLLEQQAVKIGPFTEVLPYSSFVAEKAAWKEHFKGFEAEIPYPPQALVEVLKRAKEQGMEGLEAHYTPAMRVEKDKIILLTKQGEKAYPYSGLKDKDNKEWVGLDDFVFQQISAKPPQVGKEAVMIPQAWVIWDSTPKPDYDSGNQMYPNDPLAPLIIKLTAEGKLSPSHEGSRFEVSADDYDNHIKPALEEDWQVPKDKAVVLLPNPAQNNIIGNMFHPELGQTSTYEWYQDKFGTGNRLLGGGSDGGGLVRVRHHFSDGRGDSIGFRPLVVFPQNLNS